eukprot:m.108704 g.108704  ORF g.108704 m.108704 type:complete len:154 (+) comp9193_c0_seq4:61-522(+)
MDDMDKPVVKQGIWGDDKKSKKKEDGQEDERFNLTSVPKDHDSDDEIQEIPDLDETKEEEEDITTQIADAPSANIQVATMADLDKELTSTLSFSTSSNIDLKLLINNLTPSDMLKEEDKDWDFVRVFTSIKSELGEDVEDENIEEIGEVSNAL